MRTWIYESEPDWSDPKTKIQEAYKDISIEDLYEIVKSRRLRLQVRDVELKLNMAKYSPVDQMSTIYLSSGDKFALTEIAEDQLREIVGLKDKQWFQKIPHELKDININWGLVNLRQTETRKIFRLVNGTICRAILSDRYRFFDDLDILEELREFVALHPLSYISYAGFSQESSHFRIILNKKHAVKVGDEVALGIHIRNSEVGRGSVSLRAIVYRLICANGLTLPREVLDRVHMSHLKNEEGIRRAINEFIEGIGTSWENTVDSMKRSLTEKIQDMQIILDFIRERYSLRKKDINGIWESIQLETPRDTRFALVNGISRYASNLHGDFRLRIEEIASKVLHEPFDNFRKNFHLWLERHDS